MDLFALKAKLTLDKSEYDKGLDDSESKAYKIGQGIGTVLNKTAKLTAAGMAAATTAVAGLIKQSVSEYAEYQQLLGGVQKLYGTAGMSAEEYAKSVGKSVDEIQGDYDKLTQAQDLVLKNAQDAYKTSGMSTQQYMESATSFSAALINSLGGDTIKAAEQTDVAMRAIADNYNTFGGDMANIEHAFQGFAKQNYTMLDNLKLGYGGTKTEMARLIDDANAYAKSMGMASDLSMDSFSDIVTAIDLIQQKQGVAGTTAREAASTISGSIGMLKSAWQNLVTGISDSDADITQLIGNVVESAKAVASNVIPVVKQAATGIVQLVNEVAPIVAEELPTLLEEILPMLIDTGITLFEGLINALPQMMSAIFDQLPTIITALIDAIVTLLPMIIELGGEFLISLVEGIAEALPEVMPKIIEVITKLADMLKDPEGLKNFIDNAVLIITTIAQGLIEALPVLIPAVADIILALVEALTQPDNLIMLVEVALQLVLAIVEGLIKAIPSLLEAGVVLVVNLVKAIGGLIGDLIEAGSELVGGLIDGIKENYEDMKKQGLQLIAKILIGIASKFLEIKQKGRDLVNKVKEGFKEKVEEAKQWGKDLIQNFINGILEKWEALKQTVSNVANTVKDFLGFSEPKEGPLSNFHTYAPDMMELFAKGIRDNEHLVTDQIAKSFDFSDVLVNPVIDGARNGGSVNNNTWNVNIYQPMQSASDVARKLREESQYGLIGGGAFAN